MFEIFQQFEYFPFAFPARFIISASIQLLSLLWWSVFLTFLLIVNVVVICLVLEFPVVMTVMTVNVVLLFRMGKMIVMNVLVDMMAELNFQMDMTVEWDFQMSVMNVMALVLYYVCFLDHQKILDECHMAVVHFRQI